MNRSQILDFDYWCLRALNDSKGLARDGRASSNFQFFPSAVVCEAAKPSEHSISLLTNSPLSLMAEVQK